MLWAVLVEEKRRKNANVSKSAWEYYCPSGKIAKASSHSCNIRIYTLYNFYKVYRYDEMVLKCLIYLFNIQKYYLEQF